jgi:methionyl-tRNA synthetase
LFLNLTEQQPALESWFKKASIDGAWSSNSEHITSNWLKEGLQPRCITRDLKWGTPVPHEDYKNKVFYVWFDAPIGYISITGTYLGSDLENNDWKAWW